MKNQYFNKNKAIKKSLPSTPIYQWKGVEVAEAIANGILSSFEVTKEILKRIKQVNPKLNAYIDVLEEEALNQAKLADELLTKDMLLSPLHGVSVSTKGNIDVKGKLNTNGGVSAYKDRISEGNSAVTINFNKAGCVNVGISNVPEFAYRFFTTNPLFGKTLNPYNEELTPGGSSGGAASAVVSGMCYIAHGNDIGGSIRYPAYCCGAVGLRPTMGRVPKFDPSSNFKGREFSASYFSVQGPITRNVADARAALEIMSKGHHYDQVWVNTPIYNSNNVPKRIGLVSQIEGIEIDPLIKANILKVGKILEEEGYYVEEITLPRFREAHDKWGDIVFADKMAMLKDTLYKLGSKEIKYFFDEWANAHNGGAKTAKDYLLALSLRDELRNLYNQILEVYPVIILPESAWLPFKWGDDLKDRDYLEKLILAQMPQLAMVFLNYPSMNIPTEIAKKDGKNYPIGVQLFSSSYREDLCLNIGEIIENKIKLPFCPCI